MANASTASDREINHAKPYQLALFPLNNGATNVYFILVLSFMLNFGNGVLGMAAIFVSVMITGMRLFDAITDPIIGAMIDRTNGRFGKFRPFMILGNIVMAISIGGMYILTPMVPQTMMWLRYLLFILLYIIWVFGYTFQTACTRSGQTVLTNDPKKRPMFTLFNTIGSLLGMGAIQFLAPIVGKMAGGYNTAEFFRVITPIGIGVSLILTILAVIGIWEKDQPKYFGLGGNAKEKIKWSEYIGIIRGNKPLQHLMVVGAGCKLALSIATHTAVLCMLYGSMMSNYDGLFLPMMVIGYAFSAPFFLMTIRTSQKHGQKASLQRYVTIALIMYVGVLALLLMWREGNPAFNLTLMGEGGLNINLYTILFIVFFGIGYGAYYSTADMPIPMVADCSDYETYRSGKYIPGIMGTLFSLVDKLVSSLASLVVTVAVLFIGLRGIPDQYTPYAPGMNWVVIALFCLVPMAAWIATLVALKGYSLTGEKMVEVQAVNAARRKAIADGASLEQAMQAHRKAE
ncbi:MAG: MFS transporter [Christensenellales bacterium]|jgi:Na+/melibiose symporter-like transporter